MCLDLELLLFTKMNLASSPATGLAARSPDEERHGNLDPLLALAEAAQVSISRIHFDRDLFTIYSHSCNIFVVDNSCP